MQIERLTKKFTETTALQGAIPAGATVYYAVVYENPILGANQKLLVSAAHDRAADTPVVAGANKTEQIRRKIKNESQIRKYPRRFAARARYGRNGI